MKISKFVTGTELSKAIRYVLSGQDISCAVAFWGRGMDQELNPDALRIADARIICDISMRATSAEALEGLGAPDNPNIRSLNKFHAKVYLSSNGVVIGSANASRNGVGLIDLVGEHTEAGVFHPQGSEIYEQAVDWFETLWSNEDDVLPITQEDIDYVRKSYQKHQSRQKLITRSKKDEVSIDSLTNFLSMDWQTYEDNIRYGNLRKECTNRINFLKNLPRGKPFHLMNEHQRKLFSGTIVEAGMFGSMKGFGIFMGVVNKEPDLIDDALAHIPLEGHVTKDNFDMFASTFKAAFSGKSRMGSYPSASRLLAMKRPDQFVCVNSKNFSGLSDDLDFNKNALKLDNYWELVVEPIRLCNWYNSPRPKDIMSGKIWDFRVAMIDSLYYKMQE